MNAPNLATALPVSFSAPAVEAQLRLRLLPAPHNPLPSGGALSFHTSREERAQELLGQAMAHDTQFVTAVPECPPSFAIVLESAGARLLELRLELTELGNDLQSRIEVRATSRGLASDDATRLGLCTTAHAWRLSGQATRVSDGSSLRLTFELVQELEPTEHVDVPASVQLPFGATNDGTRAARTIKIKPSGAGPVATP